MATGEIKWIWSKIKAGEEGHVGEEEEKGRLRAKL